MLFTSVNFQGNGAYDGVQDSEDYPISYEFSMSKQQDLSKENIELTDPLIHNLLKSDLYVKYYCWQVKGPHRIYRFTSSESGTLVRQELRI
jgi:hypothetical protein